MHHSIDAKTGSIVMLPYDGGLANQALRGPLPRRLTLLTFPGVDGYQTPAVGIDLSVPPELDTSTCDMGQFRSWTQCRAGQNSGEPAMDCSDVVGAVLNPRYVPGQLDSVYMVDVDRFPLVIDASQMTATSKEDLAELNAIVLSMIIDPG